MDDWMMTFREHPDQVMAFKNYKCYSKFMLEAFGEHMHLWVISPYSVFIHKKDGYYWCWPGIPTTWHYTVPSVQAKFKAINLRWAIQIPSEYLTELQKIPGEKW